ncbi:glycosyltransferase family 39 protein [Candidatus Roizmanbacteria bacterium]|nr:glycosyltransferase family 39 protein [Candidatus Roizmanbacteria bacterium]
MNKKFKKITILTLIFIFSFLIRIATINEIGQTWDEQTYVNLATNTGKLIVSGELISEIKKPVEFTKLFWFELPDPPPLSRYIYAIPAQFDKNHYDFTYTRLTSSIFASLAVVLVVLFGFEYISTFVGITAGIILTMLPVFLGLSQLATLESLIMFFFTATTYSFIKFLQKPSKTWIFFTSLNLAFALLTKYTNALLFPLIIWIYFVFKNQIKNSTQTIKKGGIIITFSTIIFITLWPLLWYRISDILAFESVLRIANTRHSIPEVFFGKLILIPKVYFIIEFLITTPVIILILFAFGLIAIKKYSQPAIKKVKNLFSLIKQLLLIDLPSKNKMTPILFTLVIWFCVPFLQSLYNYRQHGIRYIIEIYAPLSLISAVGLEYLLKKYFRNSLKVKIISLTVIITSLSVCLIKITPYYFDYFNIFVGGPKYVYDNKLFQMGWWGQGIREATYYIKNTAKPGATIGAAVVPFAVVPPVSKLHVEEYNPRKKYDFVMVSYFNVVREGFDDSIIKKTYTPIYCVNADGACLVTVYKMIERK